MGRNDCRCHRMEQRRHTNGQYDPATGTVTFSTTHFSYYAVGFAQVSFNDVAAKLVSQSSEFLAAEVFQQARATAISALKQT